MGRRLDRIRDDNFSRVAGGQVGGVREWFDIAFLLNLLDTKLCKRCKAKIEAEDE